MNKVLLPMGAIVVALLATNVQAHGNSRTHSHWAEDSHHQRDHRQHQRHFRGFGRDELRFRIFHFGWPGLYDDRHHHRSERHHRRDRHHSRNHHDKRNHHNSRNRHHRDDRGHDRKRHGRRGH